MHISGRIFRMRVTDNEEEEETQKTLRAQLVTLEGELADKVGANIPKNDNPPHSTLISHSSNPSQLTYVKKIPIYKWGIKNFSGQGSLIAF
ncbi:hypothetical protein HHI36_023911 [Cryptolaemus montrouzieri]|uniref:Uncharacterized protein n=1 Tax=Cryptolaemus montrouzieri TaxID=559131 RepID=A0ABD2N0T8_9CUCU